jgi:hypothetical protein
MEQVILVAFLSRADKEGLGQIATKTLPVIPSEMVRDLEFQLRLEHRV